MTVQRVLYPDGHDVYADDLTWMQDNMEEELQERMADTTLTGGVAKGLDPTPVVDAVDISAGRAYDGDRGRIKLDVTTQIAVAAGDVGNYIVIENVSSDTTSDAHPITNVAAFRRRELTATLSIAASPSSAQVILAKITAASPGNPPTLDTDPPNRQLLTLGVSVQGGSVSNPWITVANDGSGDYTDLASATAALPSGGGMIYVKAGVYDLTAIPVLALANVLIQGSGPFTVFRIDGSAISRGLDIDGSGVGGISNVRIKNVAFDWFNGDPGGGQNNVAIKITSATGVSIKDCYFDDTSAAVTNPIGVWIGEQAFDVRVSGCDATAIYAGVLGEPTTQADRCIICHNTLTGVTRGIDGNQNCDLWTIFDNDIQGSGIGVRMYDCNDWSITGNFISGFTTGISVDGATASTGGAITGNAAIGGTTGVALGANSNKIAVVGNNLRSNTTAVSDTGTGNVKTNNVS